MPRALRAAVSAAALALLAFLLYHSTMLPGVDFGDTPSFQVMGGNATITPRDAYPLYFAIGAPFVRVIGDRAHALNVASTVEGAVAVALIGLAAAQLAGSVAAGAAVALLFAGSYTFWSQCVITEVYALHACMMALSLLLLLRWDERPTTARLAAFFAAYAIGFGNHLAMVLLLPGFTVFLLLSAPGGWRTMLRPRIVALALAIALCGALQYAWNFRSLWLAAVPPQSLSAAISKFWFDVTKSDWRETMLANVPWGMAGERLRMYAFDVHQQFGYVVPIASAAGLLVLAHSAPRRAILVALLYLANVLFALTYDVGDSHVFFLPSHLMLALAAAPALASIDDRLSPRAARSMRPVTCLAVALAAWTIYDNYPALDRSGDTRPTDLLNAFTTKADGARAVLISGFNWQVENALTYYTRIMHPDIAAADVSDVASHADRLVADNRSIGRVVLASSEAKDEIIAAFPNRLSATRDPEARAPALRDLVADLAPGTRYVLTVLKPPRGMQIDRDDLDRALALLGVADAARAGPKGPAYLRGVGTADYTAIVGETGSAPAVVRSSERPFRFAANVGGADVDVRMESSLAFDTIRRMGFGQVVVGRHHTLIVERGISFAAFDAAGAAMRRGYVASLFAAEPRWAIVEP